MRNPTESRMAYQQANSGLSRSLDGMVAELREELKDDTEKQEEGIVCFACVFARALDMDVLEKLDNELMPGR